MIQQAVEQNVAQIIGQWDVRLRLQKSLVWLPRGLWAGLSAAIAVALLARYQPVLLQSQVLVVGLGLAAAGGVVTVAAVWLWPRPVMESARRYDRLFGLKERLSTALELSGGRLATVHGAIAALQMDDAVQSARRVDYRERMPFTLYWRDWLVAGALLALFLLLWWLPNPQADAVAAQQALEQAIQSEVRDLRSLREQALADSNLTEEEREAILQTLDEAIETLEQPGVTREEAVATLSEAGQKLRDMAGETEESERRMAELREAGEALDEAPAQPMGEAMRQGDMQRAAQAARDLASQAVEMSQEEREALAQQLEAAADALEASRPELAQKLREAAEALREGDTERARQALEEVAEQLEQQDAEQQQREQAQQSMQGMAQQMQQGQQQLAQQGQQGQPQQGQQGQQGQQQQGQQGQQGQPQNQPQAGQPGQPMQSGGEQSDQQGQRSQPGGQPSQQGQGEEPGQGNQPGEGDVMGFAQGEGEVQGQTSLEMQGQQSGGQRSAGQGQAGFDESAAGVAPDGEIAPDNRPGGQGVREYEAIAPSTRIGGAGQDEVSLPISPEDLEQLPFRPGDYSEPQEGQSMVPYNEVYGDYTSAVDEALESGRIPLGLRGVIREYFTSLEP